VKIAIIGWGSLIWDPRDLRLKSKWNKDGPELPIDFGRKSQDGRVTLVVWESRPLVRTYWSLSEFDKIELAIENLRVREGTSKRHICFLEKAGMQKGFIEESIARWFADQAHIGRDIDAAVWTGLPPKGHSSDGPFASDDEIIQYLLSLSGETAAIARQYIANAPECVDTLLRRRIESVLGWVATELSRELFEADESP
jgi:hypothetical protein